MGIFIRWSIPWRGWTLTVRDASAAPRRPFTAACKASRTSRARRRAINCRRTRRRRSCGRTSGIRLGTRESGFDGAMHGRQNDCGERDQFRERAGDHDLVVALALGALGDHPRHLQLVLRDLLPADTVEAVAGAWYPCKVLLSPADVPIVQRP